MIVYPFLLPLAGFPLCATALQTLPVIGQQNRERTRHGDSQLELKFRDSRSCQLACRPGPGHSGKGLLTGFGRPV